MAGADNIKNTGFDKRPEAINRNGRPKKLKTRIRELFNDDFGVKLSKNDVNQVIQYCLEMSMEKVRELVDDETKPAFFNCIAAAIVADKKQGRITTVESILDRIYGRPTQGVAVDPENNRIILEVIHDRSKKV
jgi:ribulose bisphosphate carboxylase small subunit